MKKKITFIAALAFVNMFTINAYAQDTITYSYNEDSISIDVEPKENIFGNANYFSDGVSGKVSLIKESNYKNSYYSLDQYKYVTYKYENVVNSRIATLKEQLIHVGQGNSHSHTETINEKLSVTYEESVAESMSTSYSIKAGVSVPVDDIKASAEAGENVTSTITHTIRASQTYTYEKGHSYTDYLNANESAMDYSWEIRGNFNVYITYLYKINYTQKSTKKKTWYGKKYHTYSYTLESLEYDDYFYTYELVDRVNEGFFKYALQPNGYWKYDDLKVDGILYLD